MNPCFVLQYNIGKMMQGLQEFMGEAMRDIPFTAPGASTAITYAGGIDGRVWRGVMSTDLSQLGTAVREMKSQGAGRAQKAQAQLDIRTIHSALTAFAVNNGGNYPDSLEVLVTPDVNGQTYLGKNKVPKDPWGHEYRYDPPSGKGKEPRVYSYGKDGKAGGTGEDADIEDAGSSDESK
jgi:type II secretion system protein G